MAPRVRAQKKTKVNDQPDFILKMKSKDRDVKDTARIGVGWLNSKGGIGIKLNKGVSISYRDSDDNIFTLWPNDEYEEEDEG